MRNLLRNLAYASVIVAATTFTVTQLNRPADAQGLGQTVVSSHLVASPRCGAEGLVLTYSGDLFYVSVGCADSPGANFIGNIWSDGPINVEPSTWSQIKAKDWKPGN